MSCWLDCKIADLARIPAQRSVADRYGEESALTVDLAIQRIMEAAGIDEAEAFAIAEHLARADVPHPARLTDSRLREWAADFRAAAA